MSTSNNNNTSKGTQVTVTGGNGFLATALIDDLVKRGYRVNATVRSIAKEKAAFDQRFPTVRLFEADLLADGTFEAAFAGSEIIFHTASPVVMQSSDPENQIIKPAVRGTENVIRTALVTPSVRRIVVTSSALTLYAPPGEVATETSWMSAEAASAAGSPYTASKTLAEQKAWSLIKEYQASAAHATRPVTLVTVLPSLIVGVPVFPTAIRSSLGLLLGIFDGSSKPQGLLHFELSIIGVKDVVKAHVDAAEKTELTGRLIAAVPKRYSFKQIAEFVRERFPQLSSNIPTEYSTPHPLGPPVDLDNRATEKQLGWSFSAPETALAAFVQATLDTGIVKVNA